MPKNALKKLPYKGIQFIDQAVMKNQMVVYGLVDLLKTPGLSETEIYRRIGIIINDLHEVSNLLKKVPVECKEEQDKKDAPAVESQSAETKNNI
jgi:hypothetical protein